MFRHFCIASLVVCSAALPSLATAQIVGIALDAKAVLEEGKTKIVQNPPPDTTVFYQFSGAHYRELGRVQVPVSFIGAPSSVVIAPDKTFAVVNSSMRIDPAQPEKFSLDTKLSVVDLTASPMRVTQTLDLSASPSSIALNPAGSFLVAVHAEDESITELSVSGHKLQVIEKLALPKGSRPQAAAFSPDGGRLLVSYSGLDKVAVFKVEGDRIVMPALHEMTTGYFPTALAFCGKTGLAVTGNYGRGAGDADTVSLIDATAAVPRVIDTVSVGPSPEDVACSPDGKYAVASVQNMSSTAPTNPLYSPHSLAVLLKIENRRLQRVAEAPFGGWSQGIGFLDDSRTIFGESIVDRSVHLFSIEGDSLKSTGAPIVFKEGAPVAFGIAGR